MRNRRWKQAGGIFLAAALLTSGTNVMAAPNTRILNPRLISNGGLLYDENSLGGKTLKDFPVTYAEFPEKYDLRDEGGVTEVEFQNPWGTCWAFGSVESLEGSTLKQGAGSNPDYSVKALAWYANQMYKGQDDPESYEEGIVLSGDNPNIGYEMGGNTGKVGAMMSSQIATAEEETVPYRDKNGTLVKFYFTDPEGPDPVYAEYYSANGDWTLNGEGLYEDAYRLQNEYRKYGPWAYTYGIEDLEKRTEIQNECLSQVNPWVKQMLMEKGSVAVEICANARPSDLGNPSVYYNEEHSAQYNPDYTAPNHMVSIVGWDDTYSKNNFSIEPPGDGAWIVKNSWSDKWGDNGYFYLSYYDSTVYGYSLFEADIMNEAGYYSHDHIYQYDYLGVRSDYTYSADSQISNSCYEDGQDVKVANVFQARGNETLVKVGNMLQECPDMPLEITTEIYRLQDVSCPVSGEPVLVQTDNICDLEYVTIELEQGIELKAGEYFSVVQKIDTGSGCLIPLEYGADTTVKVLGYDGTEYELAYNVAAEPGQTFVCTYDRNTGEESGWQDVADGEVKSDWSIPLESGGNAVPGNAMIKAFTVDTDTTLSLSNYSLNMECYSENGELLETLKDIWSDEVKALEVPAQTDSVAFVLEDRDVKELLLLSEGDSQDKLLITVCGKLYAEGEKIPFSRFKIETSEDGADINLTLEGDNRGEESSREYRMKLALEKRQDPTPVPTPDPTPEKKPTSGGNTTTVKQAVKTGDELPMAEAAAGMLLAAVMVVIVLRRRRAVNR